MLERPNVQDERISACLKDEYGLPETQVAFLPLGADLNTAVYRAAAADGTPYFLKLRRGAFDETSVALPKCLADQGIAHIIAPLATRAGRLWADADDFRVIVFPYIEGCDGYGADLSDRQWGELGTALKRIHTSHVPPAVVKGIQQESYSSQWRARARSLVARAEAKASGDFLATKLVAYLRARSAEILDLVWRAEGLAQALLARPPEAILCHSDIHAGNVLIAADGSLFIVDWDNPILAPKERDLMYVGGGQMGNWRSPQEEEALFYRGYGHTEVNQVALAYYRYERIIEDIAVECEHILLTDGGQDREQSFRYLMSNFLPNGVLEIACRSDRTLKEASRLCKG